MHHRPGNRLMSAVGLLFFGLLAANSWALTPDDIVLVVNRAVPQGRALAELYAKVRQIPDGRIIELPLTAPAEGPFPEDISPEDYDAKVLPVIRDFLKEHKLDRRVTCLVTFWGVPLRIDSRPTTDADRKEIAALKTELTAASETIARQVKSVEELASHLDPAFKPAAASDLDSMARRAEAALNRVLGVLPGLTHGSIEQADAYAKLCTAVHDLAGQPALAEKLSQPDFWSLAPQKPEAQDVLAARQHASAIQKQFLSLESGPQNAVTRAAERKLAGEDLGSLNLARIIVAHQAVLNNDQSEAAFDSELALIWWPPYPKGRWEMNPLCWRVVGRIALPAHTLMVTRLDAPKESLVRQMIESSIKVEKSGLEGEVVLDARGKPPTEPYGQYDQTIRNLAELLTTKSKLKVVLDDKEALIPKDSEDDIALYCGWYSLRKFVSPGRFNAGAVGYHVASSEMVSLHQPGETGWCANLLRQDVFATLGPVAEPYLQSFPPADEFFPLLLTGRLTLAEVYWRTTPWTSWMQCCIGDPLYTPYKMNPGLKPEDLPERLQALVR